MSAQAFVVVAVGETDNEGVLAVALSREAAYAYLEDVASEWYPTDDLAVLTARLL